MAKKTVSIIELEKGFIPEYKTKGASCADCHSRIQKWVWLKPTLIPLGFKLGLPSNYEAQVRPRSGMSKKGHFICLGTIDEDYRGEVMACVWSILPFKVKRMDRVCQLYIGKTEQPSFEVVEKLSETERGEGGFGSTGK